MGRHRCSYFKCENTSNMNSMFRFPTHDKKLLKVWLDNCGNTAIAQMRPEVLRGRFVCIDHFDKKYLSNVTGRRKRLLRVAIPKPYQVSEAVDHQCTSPGPSDLKVQKPNKTYGNMRLLNEVPEEPDDSLSNFHWNTPMRRQQNQEVKEIYPKMQKVKNVITDEESLLRVPAEDEYKIKVFCPKCNTEVSHTAEGIQKDQSKIIIAKVYHFFEQEYEELMKTYEGLDLTPLSKFFQRTALAIGVSESTVREILQEEERRNADKPQEQFLKRDRPRKRPRQTDSSNAGDSFENNDDGNEQSGTDYPTEMLTIKIEPIDTYSEEPEIYTELAHVKDEPNVSEANEELADPLFVDVKIEPRNEAATNSNETRVVQPTSKCYKGRTWGRNAEFPPGPSAPPGSSAPPGLSAPLGISAPPGLSANPGPSTSLRGLLLFEEDEIKMEDIEIKEEGVS